MSDDRSTSETIPTPSLWPAGFAIGVACALIGLVVSVAVLVVGLVVAAVFAVLWIRASSRPASEPTSAPTVEPVVENAEDTHGETYDRGAFLTTATIGLGAVIGAAVTIPALGFAVLPSFVGDTVSTNDVDLGPISSFPKGTFVIATYLEDPEQGEVSRRTAFIRNNGFTESGVPSFTALFSRCVHLGCPVQPNGPIDEESRTEVDGVELRPVLAASFGCPCHGGQYDAEGNRTAGPPVRSLDRYEFSIKDGRLVLGRLFSVGTVEGTGAGATISKYYKAYPGVHVDGPERWLYPIPTPGSTSMKSTRRRRLEAAALAPLDWVEERSGLVGYIGWFLFRKVPRDTNWMQTLGAATLTAFIVQAVTGVVLAMYYTPDPNSAYSSIQKITEDVTLGWLVRGMHKWGASVFIILMFFHMARTFLFGAYKYPREVNWITGVLILVMGMAEGFTGYLLPWDQTAYWATVVGININATAPFLGPFIAQFLQGGLAIGPDTLAKFYALHMLVIPGAIMGLIGLHMYLVVRLGVTSPPWSKVAAGRERDGESSDARKGLIREPATEEEAS